ncbi:hypothetical protein DENSPDRAFT_881797 [Dentipellis sp. KUC8613]|nr:hypothetical protein DENSPDRAFT_881797 [Dentipellis sp. KUC8613]
MRIYALYGGSRRVAVLIGSVSSILAAVTVWSLLGQHSTTVPDVQGCHLATSNKTQVIPPSPSIAITNVAIFQWYTCVKSTKPAQPHNLTHSYPYVDIAVAWEAQAIFDMMMMILTVYKTVQTRRELGLRPVGGNRGLVDLVFRDGAIYFAVMAGANISNILTFYLANPILKGVLSTFAGCISVMMMSRLMLNLYEATTPASSMFSSTTRSNIYFTTRLDAGALPTHTSLWPYGPSIPTAELDPTVTVATSRGDADVGADGEARVSDETVRARPQVQEIELVDIHAVV